MAPIILLIEDDEFDRMTLTRMLKDHGYGVIASNRGASAVDTFAINHQRVSLVLASTGLSDVERIRLDEALYRIDPFVPVVIATRRPLHRRNSGEDSGRSAMFAALIAETDRQLRKASARAAAQADSFAQVQAPAPSSSRASSYHDAPRADEMTDRDDVFFPDIPDAATLVWAGSSHLTPIANLDPRLQMTHLRKARRTRRKRIRRIGMLAVAAGCAPLVVPPLLEMRTTIARAITREGPVQTTPLASASISGVVPLISSAHVSSSRLADDLRTIQPKMSTAHQDRTQR